MSEMNKLCFPELLCFEDYSGRFNLYFDAVYAIFKRDFINSQPFYVSLRVSARKYPLEDGVHRTFYHITHEGANQSNRHPDIRRMERIRFPRFVIEHNRDNEILIWKNKRGRNKRVLLFNEAESYLVVLEERNGYYLFITAYLVEREHRKKKLIKEYKAYKKTETA